MDKPRSTFGCKELRGGERIIICLSYGWVVCVHSNHNIVIHLQSFCVLYKVLKVRNIGVSSAFMIVLFLCKRET